MNNQAIGVFDSGVGGLSVLKVIQQLLPNEDIIYLADSKYIPYGEKEASFIVERSVIVTNYLLSQGIKALVIACNTATAAAAALLREQYPSLPIIAMEPAVKPATKATINGKVGVLATSGTLRSAKFAALLDKFANNVAVFAQPCPGLMECIERGELITTNTRQLLFNYLQPLLAAGCDTIILGCTHYPFLRPLLSQLLPANVVVIDTGEAVARHLNSVLDKQQLLADRSRAGQIKLLTTGELNCFKQTIHLLWQSHYQTIEQLNL